MASVSKNKLGTTKLTRGFPVNLGTIVSAGDVVTFTIPEPTKEYRGSVIIQTQGGTTPSCVLEGSIDGGNSWFTWPTSSTTGVVTIYALSGQPGGDTAATFAAKYEVSGHGSGTLFKFGRTDANGGSAIVFALVG